jgi:16S rRNA (cytidine1402-2'-O)-methyltransferase
LAGKLYLVATPIGNLEDITMRAVRILNEVDVIAAEDTRQTIKLLNHYEIKTPLTSYHEHNKATKTSVLVNRLLAGENVAEVSDAGTPGISDPGEDLARAAFEAGVEVTSLPGATAVITALVLSGQSTRRFAFEGFLPTDKKDRALVLSDLEHATRSTVFYEAPHRLIKTLQELACVVGNERKVAVCKELTKKHETILQTTFGEAIAHFTEQEPRGEFVLVVEGKTREQKEQESVDEWTKLSIPDHMEHYISQGMDKKSAMKQVAKDRGVSKREIYQYIIEKEQC